jgi:ABC-type Mn2+/Zn2+ transport system ATPase subunit
MENFSIGLVGEEAEIGSEGDRPSIEEGRFCILDPWRRENYAPLHPFTILFLIKENSNPGTMAFRDGQRSGKVNISVEMQTSFERTVRENLHFYGMLYGLTGNRRVQKVNALINLFNLEEHQDSTFDRLSTGMKQRLSLAKSLINDPAVLFLDEPTVGLDPSVSILIREQVRMIQKERGMTVLLTTHNMKEAEFLCNRILSKEWKIYLNCEASNEWFVAEIW